MAIIPVISTVILRIIDPLDPLFHAVVASQSCRGLQQHGFRSRVAEEWEACSALGKLADPAVAETEFKYDRAQGFADTLPLTVNNLLRRWHRPPGFRRGNGALVGLFQDVQDAGSAQAAVRALENRHALRLLRIRFQRPQSILSYAPSPPSVMAH